MESRRQRELRDKEFCISLPCMSLAGHFAFRKLYISRDGLANRRDNAQRGLSKPASYLKHGPWLVISKCTFLVDRVVQVRSGSA